MLKFSDSVSVTTLDNGITVINDFLPQSPVMSARLTFGIGSHHDPDNKLGLAHFAEHMMGCAVPGLNINEFFNDIADLGAVESNMTTGYDQTVYFSHGLPESIESFITGVAHALVCRDYMYIHGRSNAAASSLKCAIPFRTPSDWNCFINVKRYMGTVFWVAGVAARLNAWRKSRLMKSAIIIRAHIPAIT